MVDGISDAMHTPGTSPDGAYHYFCTGAGGHLDKWPQTQLHGNDRVWCRQHKKYLELCGTSPCKRTGESHKVP